MPDLILNTEQILHASFNCYQQALSIEPSDNIRRRIGNVHNELGAFYMNQIACKYIISGQITFKICFIEYFQLTLLGAEFAFVLIICYIFYRLFYLSVWFVEYCQTITFYLKYIYMIYHQQYGFTR